MAVDADILLDRRRLIEWVLEPLYGASRILRGAPGEATKARDQ
jgi:membrane fusion protein